MTAAPRVVVHPDADLLAEAVAARLLTHLIDLQSVRTPLHVVLTGGTVGIAALRAVAASGVRDAVDWTGVHLWWGDERFVPTGDPERNEGQARAALLDPLGAALPDANVHVMPALGAVPDVGSAARAYADELAAWAPAGAAVPVPVFDVVLLGMGPDGHVASLFPGHDTLHVTDRTVVAESRSPKPPPARTTLTFPAIRSARAVWLVVAGAEKAEPVARVLGGAPVEEVPAAGAAGTEQTLWLLDVAASAQLEEAADTPH